MACRYDPLNEKQAEMLAETNRRRADRQDNAEHDGVEKMYSKIAIPPQIRAQSAAYFYNI
ncbi:hypothetical protein [Aquicella lusitana]|uniref:hypothetical protein n=1 Tax=Aquicella lusitana TaxID=254246 RepID=UPI000E0C6941|nr:hypothetical protein [Aquicella lusitana]VVC73511.1 hypothetical protein AQULUS_12540 [Aquicella lusitana]